MLTATDMVSTLRLTEAEQLCMSHISHLLDTEVSSTALDWIGCEKVDTTCLSLEQTYVLTARRFCSRIHSNPEISRPV